MSYEEVVGDVVKVVEAIGAAIMVLGGAWAIGAYLLDAARGRGGDASYKRLRQDLGRVILLGLEVLIVADIVRTIVVDQTIQSVTVLAIIVVIRIVLSFSLEVEIDGVWPWNRWRTTGRTTGGTTGGAPGGAPGDTPQ